MTSQITPTKNPNPAPPGKQLQRLAIILGILFALLAAGYFFVLRMDYEPLFEGLKPSDASVVVSELSEQGVRYKLADEGATILVEAGKRDEARLAILGSDIASKGLVGFELFDQSEMGLTDFAQKIKYQRALQGELARSITMMDGIETARVHIAIPERAMFRGGDAGPTAAVTISSVDGMDPAPESIEGIRQLVAASVPELLSVNVVVLNEQGRILSSTEAAEPEDLAKALPGTVSGDGLEAHYQQRAITALDTLLTVNRPDVLVNFDMGATAEVPQEIGGASPQSGAVPVRRLRVAVISDDAFGDAERIRIGEALSAVLPDALFSVSDLTFLDRGLVLDQVSETVHPAAGQGFVALLERIRLSRIMTTHGGPILASAGGVLVLMLLLITLLMRRKGKGLTPEEHREFAELLKLEFAPAEEVVQ